MFEAAMRERDALRARLDDTTRQRDLLQGACDQYAQVVKILRGKLDNAELGRKNDYEAWQRAERLREQAEAKLAEAELKAADRVEWQAVAMKVSNERDALLAKLHKAEARCRALETIQQAEQRRADFAEKEAADTPDELTILRSKLDASERAAAEMRKALTDARSWVVGDTRDENAARAALAKETVPELDHALSSDAGRDYVLREEKGNEQ